MLFKNYFPPPEGKGHSIPWQLNITPRFQWKQSSLLLSPSRSGRFACSIEPARSNTLFCDGPRPHLSLPSPKCPRGPANRRNAKEITVKRTGGIGYFFIIIFWREMGPKNRKTTFNCICSPRAWSLAEVRWLYPGPEPWGWSPPDLRTSLGCGPPKWPKPDRASNKGHLHPSSSPRSILGVTGTSRDRKLFGPQSYFRYFLWERKWKLIQEQGFTKEAICLLDYLFACQSLSYGTG